MITADGRVIVGVLHGFDQVLNLVLQDCVERVFSAAGVVQNALGLYVVRGENVAAVGKIELELDEGIDWASKKADPIKPIVH